ncbi:unnamed protein product, partial [Discosporangium mesarthrocarpum]
MADGARLTDEGHKLYRIRQTCLKMLVKRGYNVLDEQLNMSSEKFVDTYGTEPARSSLTLLVDKV